VRIWFEFIQIFSFFCCQIYQLSNLLRYKSVGRNVIVSLAILLAAAQAAWAGGPMTLPMSFKVDNLGSAKLDLPLDVPPGTAGMVPHLSLSYSSSAGNGYLGVGWNLSGLPAITRCPWTIATNGSAEPVTFANGSGLTTYDYDVYCFQGQPLVQAQQQSVAGEPNAQGLQFSQQLILLPGNSYYGADGATYSTEIEDFSRIVSHNPGSSAVGAASFTVYTRSGLIYEFGGTSDSQVLCTTAPACSGTTTVMTWMLDKVTDPVGNQIQITYTKNGSRAYPYKIYYTVNSGQSLGYTNAIFFTYESRSDAPVQFFAGQQVQTSYLLQNIVTYVWINGSSNPVTKYTFGYGSGLTGRSRLTSVTRNGTSGNTSEILPASFGYCDLCGAPADLLSSFNNGLEGATNITYGLTTHSSVYGPSG